MSSAGRSGILCFCAVLAALLLVAALAGAAQTPPERTIPRTGAAPVIDGVVEDMWKEGLELAGFTSLITLKPAALATTVYMLYDDDFLYVCFVCRDDAPGEIKAIQRVRNSGLGIDDFVSLYLDTLKDGKGYYVFSINPLGTQSCFSTRDIGWDTDWKAAAKVGKDGWTAEMAIPFKDMKRGQGELWGLNAARSIKRFDESCVWHFVDKNNSLVPLYLPAARIAPKKTRPAPEVIVQAMAVKTGSDNTEDPNRNNQVKARIGADIRYPVTSTLDFTVTAQPDFSELQREELTIVPQETEVYYGEYRPFFQEGAGYLNAPGINFYSRRIRDLDWGVKLTGREGMFRVGTLATSAAQEKDAVVVLKGDMLKSTLTVGGQWMQKETPGEGKDSANAVFFTYIPVKELSFGASVSRHDTATASRGSVSADAYYEKGDWWWGASYDRTDPGFNPALSYTPLQDIDGTSYDVGYFREFKTGKTRSRSFYLGYRNYRNTEGQPAIEDWWADYSQTFMKPVGFSVGASRQYFLGNLNRNAYFTVRLNPRYWDSTYLSYSFGDYHERPIQNLMLNSNFLVHKVTRLSLGYDWVHYTDDDLVSQAHSFKRVSLYHEFNPDNTATLNVRVDEDNDLNVYFVYRRHLKVRSDLYLIVGDPNSATTSSKVILKVTYRL